MMAFSNTRRLQSQMMDALSCIICFQPYDLDSRVPKVFPCQHTVCLVCAKELCQQDCGDSFPCATCRQPIPIPSTGASGLKTNLDVSNMVEIIQGTTDCSIANPNCPDHAHKPISNVCMVCGVGLCSKCFTSSAMKQHSDHRVLEIDEAFDEITKTCDVLAKQGNEACQAIQEKRDEIESMTIALQAARASKCLRVFEIIEKLSGLLKTTQGDKEPNGSVASLFGRKPNPDRICTDDIIEDVLNGIDHGKLHFRKAWEENTTAESVTCMKLGSITLLLDLLRMKLHKKKYDGSVKALNSMWNLSNESEACCHRIVLLGGGELLVSYFEANIRNKDICRLILGVYCNLATFYSLHNHIISTGAIKMLVHCIQNVTKPQNDCLPLACASLSFFLCSTTARWPENCFSHGEASNLVIDTCEKLSKNNKFVYLSFDSLQSVVSIMSQQVSQAAKYWAVCQLYYCTRHEPDAYCRMLIRDGGLPVLKQQHAAPTYAQKLSKSIVEQVMKYTR